MPAHNLLRRGYRCLVRIDVAAALVAATLAVAALGSCVPQLPSNATLSADRLAAWQADVHARFGGAADWMVSAGAFRFYSSPAFLIPAALLTAASVACVLHRWRPLWRRAVGGPGAGLDLDLDRAPHKATLAASAGGDLVPGLCASLRRRGFQVRIEASSPVTWIQAERNRWVSLASLANHVAVPLLVFGALLSAGMAWSEELTVAPGQSAEVHPGTGLSLCCPQFAVERYPDGSVSSYVARVELTRADGSTIARSLRVNEPLTDGAVSFYLSGYQPAAGGYQVTLLAAYDPGYSLVIGCGLVMLVSAALAFNFPRSAVYARREVDGTWLLAGSADRRAWEFGVEFDRVVDELREGSERPC